MLQLTQCRLPYEEDSEEKLRSKVARILHISLDEIEQFEIVRRSMDARKKPFIFVTYTVWLGLAEEEKVWKKNRKIKELSMVKEIPSLWKKIEPAAAKEKIVIVGAGPAGLFCAYYLSLCGLRPVLIERGAPMEERVSDVEKFWESGKLDGDSNVSFGEGGAGTFSDGKLNTGVKDRTGRKQFVLESFVRFGAGKQICYDAYPHIGTDVLRSVIVSMRKEMERLGCTFLFHTKLTDVQIVDGRVKEIVWEQQGKEERACCERLVLATGHSARDTFSMLYENGMKMVPKSFAIGTRVEHRQEQIDLAQYGILDDRLPPSPYKLTGKTLQGRGVYSFCMCPGGYVVNASSEGDGLVVNGMSNRRRDSGYANSAIVVTVTPEDFGSFHPLAGVEFQREYERKMYDLCGGFIPVQKWEDFLQDRESVQAGNVLPCVKGKWKLANLRQALPNVVINGMIEGMEQFGKKIRGFDNGDTLLLGLESRTSSPVRMERGEELESVSWQGVYPCGEGAGYAGGIMSAAMDGLRVAMKIQENIS